MKRFKFHNRPRIAAAIAAAFVCFTVVQLVAASFLPAPVTA